ncbi:MAG TPA: ADOP family duplicated permease [Terriglobales bacterium]|nr:ADOP family duplicated permease [Terriglobales bacterium]
MLPVLRGLRHQPGFVLVAILSLALGIGANTAIFSLVDAALLRSLPVSHQDQLYALIRLNQRDSSTAAYHALRGGLPVGSDLIAQAHPFPVHVQVAGATPRAVTAQLTSANYFAALGVQPWRGRFFNPDDTLVSAPLRVAVISYAFWRREYDGAPALGHALVLNRQAVDVIGIAPPGFSGLDKFKSVDVWSPLPLQHLLGYDKSASLDSGMGGVDPSQPWATQSGIGWLQLYARVRPPVAPAAVASAASAIGLASLRNRYAGASPSDRRALIEKTQMRLVPLAQASGGAAGKLFSSPLLILTVAVEAVLLIACLNLVLLVLARDAARRQEDAVRLALGAGHARLFRRRFAEILILAVAGAGLGLLLARWMVIALPGALSTGSVPAAAGFDWRVLAFTLAVAFLCALALALAPWIGRRRDDPLNDLRSGALSGGGSSSLIFGRGGRWFITGQIALAFVLTVSAGLLTRSLQHLLTTQAGFDRRNVLTARMDPAAAGYSPVKFVELYPTLLDHILALPGVRSAAVAACGWYCDITGSYRITASGNFSNPAARMQVDIVSRDFFATAGLHLLRGRGFTREDTAASPGVALVNQAFLRRYFPNRDPVSSQLTLDDFDNPRVVGVVADAQVDGLLSRVPPMVYLDLDQNPLTVRALEIRTAGDPAALIPALRRALDAAAPNVPVSGMETVEANLEGRLVNQHLIARLYGLFAWLALMLACLGMYGVQSWRLNRRRRELGVRLALGADPAALFRLVIVESLGLTAAGVITGAIVALFAVRLLRAQLFGLSPVAPRVFGLGVLAVLITAVAASALPAIRAARTDAAVALRCD